MDCFGQCRSSSESCYLMFPLPGTVLPLADAGLTSFPYFILLSTQMLPPERGLPWPLVTKQKSLCLSISFYTMFSSKHSPPTHIVSTIRFYAPWKQGLCCSLSSIGLQWQPSCLLIHPTENKSSRQQSFISFIIHSNQNKKGDCEFHTFRWYKMQQYCIWGR